MVFAPQGLQDSARRFNAGTLLRAAILQGEDNRPERVEDWSHQLTDNRQLTTDNRQLTTGNWQLFTHRRRSSAQTMPLSNHSSSPLRTRCASFLPRRSTLCFRL